jgi:undecaprenyl-diphosphatase
LTIFHAVILGIVQGLGEFLPISSSAHLILAPWLFKFPDPGLAFDAALHFGTALAIIVFFWKDLLRLVKAWFASLAKRRATSFDERFAWYMLLGSIPGGLFGILLEKKAETAFRAPLLIAATLAVMGVILYAADRYSKKTKDINHVGWKDALLVGTAQAIAIIPGVSRSGITMTTSLFRNFKRADAARFSFLLSAPITVGAALYEARKLLHGGINAPFFVGVAVSAIVGYLSIKYLLKYLQKSSFAVFAVYRLLLAATIVALVLTGLRPA